MVPSDATVTKGSSIAFLSAEGEYLQSSDCEQRVAQSSRFRTDNVNTRAEFQEVGTSSLPSERWKSFRGLRYPVFLKKTKKKNNLIEHNQKHSVLQDEFVDMYLTGAHCNIWARACTHITFGPRHCCWFVRPEKALLKSNTTHLFTETTANTSNTFIHYNLIHD